MQTGNRINRPDPWQFWGPVLTMVAGLMFLSMTTGCVSYFHHRSMINKKYDEGYMQGRIDCSIDRWKNAKKR